ncbi:hypothetical protein LF845_01310 [Deferribacterales bacterium Es71-Z0220]|uniref:hypothetical protein n=1 Tax=Deferrivibrio essentukiensis TaxID=2880922 RepID=UPI001F6152BE|nr:hypothetical protein [Deferrivibrio essentukiensis]MCB4203593.1 hypothetical protein [Deferrivibrio essentukiensis]
MTRKNNQMSEEAPIDKVESFLNKNFKVIISSIAGVIALILVVYMVYKNIQSSKIAKLDNLGNYEVSIAQQNVSEDILESYGKSAESFSDQKDYIYLRIAQIYISKGNIDKAKSYLSKVNGNLKELSDSLMYDLGDANVASKYNEDSRLHIIWDYRKALAGGDVKSFLDKYPNSNLAELIKNWES